ncbi:hypothetical protein QZH41_017366, partial [Actinostola sp. cb2023]
GLEFPEDMKINLEKLRALSKDDLTENAMLRSRIDQQVELICILKRRADDSLKKSLKLDEDNEELRHMRNEALTTMQAESRKYYVLQKRFEILNTNHEEMITIKDDYKTKNGKLRRENEKLSHENKLLFAETVKKRDKEIKGLREEVDKLTSQCCSSNEARRMAEERKAALSDQFLKDKKVLEEKLATAEENFNIYLSGVFIMDSNKKKDEISSLKEALREEGDKMLILQKDRDEFAQIAVERGKVLTGKQKENAQIMTRLDEAEKTIKEMEDKFSSELQSMSTSSQVRRLRKELEETEKKYQEQRK